jgi:hypothetical protein
MASEQLKQMIRAYLENERAEGRKCARERLAANAEVSMSTLQNAIKGRKIEPAAMYSLAVHSGGATKEAAKALAGLAAAEAIGAA